MPLQVDNLGTVNLVEACRKAGVTRFVLVSSILVNGAAMGQLLNPAYIVLNLFGLVLVAKLQAEKYIRGSGINYTIVRPGGLTEQPPTGNIVMEPEVSNSPQNSSPWNLALREIVAHTTKHTMFICEIFAGHSLRGLHIERPGCRSGCGSIVMPGGVFLQGRRDRHPS